MPCSPPCGSAWWESIKRDSTLELYSGDQSHPAYAGSYLNGCVFYATMYRRSPVGLNFFGSLDTTTARFLQQVAHDVVFDSLVQWRVGLDDVVADWAWVSDFQGNTNFSNTSVNATSYQWTFGDGGTSTQANPLHVYGSPGLFPVTLIATDGCTTDTLTDTVEIILVGTKDPLAADLQISPNPSEGIFAIAGPLNADGMLQVTDLQGRIVFQRNLTASAGRFATTLDLRGLARGTYLLRVDGARAQRLLIH